MLGFGDLLIYSHYGLWYSHQFILQTSVVSPLFMALLCPRAFLEKELSNLWHRSCLSIDYWAIDPQLIISYLGAPLILLIIVQAIIAWIQDCVIYVWVRLFLKPHISRMHGANVYIKIGQLSWTSHIFLTRRSYGHPPLFVIIGFLGCIGLLEPLWLFWMGH